MSHDTIQGKNKAHYDQSWSGYKIIPHTSWPHWKIISSYAKPGKMLELGPGNRPRIPIKGNSFVEISTTSAQALRALGGIVIETDLTQKLPFQPQTFQVATAFEILEHLPNDEQVLREMSRVLKDSGVCIVSFPLNPDLWNAYDVTVGHVRRYDPNKIEALFGRVGFRIVSCTGIHIPWPSKYTGMLLSWVYTYMPKVAATGADVLDRLPGAAVHTFLSVEPWTSESAEELANYTTGLFVLQKLK